MVVWEALDALSHQLELCKIDASTRVVLLLDDHTSAERASLLRAALSRSGADAIELRSIRGAGVDDDALLLAALTHADVVVATTETAATAQRDPYPKHILVVASDSAPQDYPPHANLRRRVQSLHHHIASGDVLKITDSNGTALQVNLASGAVTSDHGLFDDAIKRVDFPAGWAAITPAAGTVHGELVIMPGDGNSSGRRHVSSPLRLDVFDDHVSTIDGDSPDADVIRALFEYSGQPSAYGIAGVTIGMNPGRQVLAPFDDRLLLPQLSRLAAGMVTISFGRNLLADRPCNQTVTLALPGRSVEIDGLPIVASGTLDGDFAPDVYEL